MNHTARYLGPLLAWSAMIMVTKALTSGFDWLYPAQVLAMAAAIWLLWGRAIAAKGWPDYLAPGAVGIGVLVFCLWTVLTLVSRPVGGEERSIATALAAMPVAWAAVWSACRVVGFIVTVPITEELAFRGYLLRQLIGARFEAIDPRRFTWISFVISSVLFGALHGQRWVPGILAGMCYAWAVYRRGKLSDAVVAHATTNGLLAIVALVSGDWALWM